MSQGNYPSYITINLLTEQYSHFFHGKSEHEVTEMTVSALEHYVELHGGKMAKHELPVVLPMTETGNCELP